MESDMKKLFYIVLLVVVLLVIAHFVKNNRTTSEFDSVNVNEIITIGADEVGNIVSEEDIIFINDGSGMDAPIDSVEEIIEEDIIEEDPSLTADDGETIINE